MKAGLLRAAPDGVQICDADVRIVYQEFSGLPRGIRDKSGYLFMFRDVYRYEGQDERYENECKQLHALARYLLEALTLPAPPKEPPCPTSTG